jgi:hypothetical protein
VTSIQPELWVDRGAQAVAFYQAAFGATVLHRVGEGEDIVAQLAIGGAAFWVSTAGSSGQRLNPKAIGGATRRSSRAPLGRGRFSREGNRRELAASASPEAAYSQEAHQGGR